jgi:tetratricopeptide (TPR) repeat protein
MWNIAAKWPSPFGSKEGSSSIKDRLTRLYSQACRSARRRGETVPSPAIAQEPSSSTDYIARGNVHLDLVVLDRAIADYSRAIELDPQSSIAYNNRGVAHALAGEQLSAIGDYDQAAAIDPNSACAHLNRADAWRERGECERALADYTRAIELDPDCAEAYCERAEAYRSGGDLERAVSDFDKAVELDATNAVAHLGLGRVHAKRGAFDLAVASFTRAIAHAPDLAAAYNERGHAHLGAKNFALAAVDYGKAMELDPAIAQDLRAAEAALELRPGRPAQAPQPGAVKAHDGLAPSFYDYFFKPTGFYFWQVPFDARDFANRPPEVATALAAALDAYRNRDHDNILDALDKIEQTDPLVELFRGLGYIAKSNSVDCAQNEARAERHFRAAIGVGDPKSAAILGVFLTMKLEGIAQDIPQARELAESAARCNDSFAIRQLAIQTLNGTLAPADPVRAADLMWTAAELGDPVANAMVGAFFSAGTGLEKDQAKAELYLRRAADLGMTDAQNIFAELQCRRYYRKLTDTPELGVRYYERALKCGNSVWAASRLAGLYGCDGREAPWRNFEKARHYIDKCAVYSDSGIHFALGAVYRSNGDFVSSWAYYNVARCLGSKDAVDRIASLEELLTPKETQRALEQSQKIQDALKPFPQNIMLQGPETI